LRIAVKKEYFVFYSDDEVTNAKNTM
jgi:hypothetical protein